MPIPSLNLVDNASLHGREDKYDIIDVNLEKILEGWKISLFSFEWLLPDGSIRPPDKLPDAEREKYHAVLAAYESGEVLERPILGIGIMDNIEIGARRDVLLSLMSVGIKTLSVHIPKSAREDFAPYL